MFNSEVIFQSGASWVLSRRPYGTNIRDQYVLLARSIWSFSWGSAGLYIRDQHVLLARTIWYFSQEPAGPSTGFSVRDQLVFQLGTRCHSVRDQLVLLSWIAGFSARDQLVLQLVFELGTNWSFSGGPGGLSVEDQVIFQLGTNWSFFHGQLIFQLGIS